MSCAPGIPKFRLLDAFVGWDRPITDKEKEEAKKLTGFDDPEGVRLALEIPDAIDPNAILNYLPPPRLAFGCDPCQWYLITPSPPSPRLLTRTNCPGEWLPVWHNACDPKLMMRPVAIAARGRRIAVSDAGTEKVWVWTKGGERLVADIDVTKPGAVAFAPWGELFVVSKDRSVQRFGSSGESRGKFVTAPGRVERMRISEDCTIWIVTLATGGSLKLWNARRGDTELKPATLTQLVKAFPPNGLVAMSDEGFCIEERGLDGLPLTRCFSWYGRPLDAANIPSAPLPVRYKKGEMVTVPIDSGIPRCRWHRVRIDADVPTGTTLRVSVASSETNSATPNSRDWWPAAEAPAELVASQDFLIQQPPGRYLYLRMELTGDGSATPVVRRIRLDFPRVTSLEHLPTVYRERPDAEDFTERFLSLFDASVATIDRAIERFPALLDPDGAPDQVLPWLGGFLDISFDRAWTPERMRKILKAVPELYRRRGTLAGLAQSIKLVFDVDPVIKELADERNWVGLGDKSRGVGTVRLFGKSRARFRVGSSALSSAPLRSFGNPDADPLIAQANRFSVLVPPSRQLAPHEQERLERLVASQKPAHTVAVVRVGGNGFLLGTGSAVGIDTMFTTLPPPVLKKNIRLGRASVLWHGRRGRQSGLVPDKAGVVGVSTIME